MRRDQIRLCEYSKRESSVILGAGSRFFARCALIIIITIIITCQRSQIDYYYYIRKSQVGFSLRDNEPPHFALPNVSYFSESQPTTLKSTPIQALHLPTADNNPN